MHINTAPLEIELGFNRFYLPCGVFLRIGSHQIFAAREPGLSSFWDAWRDRGALHVAAGKWRLIAD